MASLKKILKYAWTSDTLMVVVAPTRRMSLQTIRDFRVVDRANEGGLAHLTSKFEGAQWHRPGNREPSVIFMSCAELRNTAGWVATLNNILLVLLPGVTLRDIDIAALAPVDITVFED